MYYVRNSSNTIFNAISQNRSNSQFNNKTGKSITLLKKPKIPVKSEIEKMPYFSISDVDIKKISNGTSLEKQYVRTEKSIQKSNFSKTMTKFKEFPNPKDSVEITNNENNIVLKTSVNFFKPKESKELPQLKDMNNNKNNLKNEDNDGEKTVNKSYGFNGFNMKQENIDYNRKLHTSNSNRIENVRISQQLKAKMIDSDPFFVKKQDSSNEKFLKIRENNLKAEKINYFESDVFNMKDFDIKKEKSIDKYILTREKVKLYGSSNASKSEWCPKNINTNLLNHTSVPYSIFNSNNKSFVKTKQEIYVENNGSPANRQKSICEFIDLARVFCPNSNKEYLNALQKSSSAFHKTSDICANFQDLHKLYRPLCEKPFVKKII